MSDTSPAEHPASDGSVHSDEAGGGGGRTFVRAGATLRYWAIGERDAPTVVCTHGVTLDHGAFAEQVPVLRDAGWRVVTWDLRGHGSSPRSSERFSVQGGAEDLRVLLDEVGAEQAVLVGQSFGGFVAQELYRRQPQCVAALVLVSTPALGDRPPWHQRVLQRARPFLLRLWPERHLRRVLPAFMSQRAEVQRYVARATQPLSKADLIAFTEAALEELLRSEPLPVLDVPVLLVHGSREHAMVVRMIRAWAASDARVQIEVVNDAGHLANQDNPAVFNEVLLAFLRQHRPA